MLQNKKIIAQFGLLITALIWGATFIVVKDAIHLDTFPPFVFAAVRFSLAAICIVFFVDFKSIKENALGPILCGIILFIGYGFQNYGLEATSPTNSAFITSISVLMVPVILYIFRFEKISLRIWISVLLAFIGIQMISPNGFNIGDKLTFGCALSFAIHIIMQDRFNKEKVINFFVIQSSVAALLSFIASLIVDDISKVIFSNEAVIAAKDLKAKYFMPIHWGAFVLSTHEWDEPINESVFYAKKYNQKIITPKIGEILDLIIIDEKVNSWWNN